MPRESAFAKSSSSFVLDPFGGFPGGGQRRIGIGSHVETGATIFEDEAEDEDDSDVENEEESASHHPNTH